MRVALIGCSKTKLSGVHAAKNLYQGSRFKFAWEYAQKAFDSTYILSAKHGLLHPTKRIRSYDRTLADAPRKTRERWAKKVARQVREEIQRGSHLEFLCGSEYYSFGLMLLLSEYGLEFPLAGMNQGKQLAWLKKKSEEPKRILIL